MEQLKSKPLYLVFEECGSNIFNRFFSGIFRAGSDLLQQTMRKKKEGLIYYSVTGITSSSWPDACVSV
jgi:hypothetical protein